MLEGPVFEPQIKVPRGGVEIFKGALVWQKELLFVNIPKLIFTQDILYSSDLPKLSKLAFVILKPLLHFNNFEYLGFLA